MAKNHLKHLKIQTGDEWRKIFAANFDPVAYENAIAPINDAIAQSKTALELYYKLRELERDKKCEYIDTEHWDDCTIIMCNVELDRSRMSTDADYVSAFLKIRWDEEEKRGEIWLPYLFSNVFSKGYHADALCRFNTESFDIMEWLY